MYEGEFKINGLSECVDMSSGKRITTEGIAASQEVVRSVFKKDGWLFNWKMEYEKTDRKLFYLRTCTEDPRAQGFISATPMFTEKYIFLHLIEKAPHNMGRERKYDLVSDCLIAYMCKTSYELGFDGFVAFVAKTKLIDHYTQKFGAEMINPRQNRMCINSLNALKLVNLCIKKM